MKAEWKGWWNLVICAFLCKLTSDHVNRVINKLIDTNINSKQRCFSDFLNTSQKDYEFSQCDLVFDFPQIPLCCSYVWPSCLYDFVDALYFGQYNKTTVMKHSCWKRHSGICGIFRKVKCWIGFREFTILLRRI